MKISPTTPPKPRSFNGPYMAKRILFDPPRQWKPKTDPHIKSLLVRCSFTSKLTNTGQTIEEKRGRRAKIKTQKFPCAHCGCVHTWTKKDVVLGRAIQ